jgi:hypothetical protein
MQEKIKQFHEAIEYGILAYVDHDGEGVLTMKGDAVKVTLIMARLIRNLAVEMDIDTDTILGGIKLALRRMEEYEARKSV